MDINMPNMDGFEATERILEITELPKIIALTAYSSQSFIDKGKEVGMSDYFARPLVKAKLDRIISYYYK